MFVINEDNSIYVTRGDILFFKVNAKDGEDIYHFSAGDVVRILVYGKKDCENVVLQKDFPVLANAEEVEIYLSKDETKYDEIINKPKDYWYEVVVNPDTAPQTIIGYGDDGPALFKLFPEGEEIESYVPNEEDIPFVDDELDLTSNNPVANRVIAARIARIERDIEKDYVTPKMFGAVGDGKADDTEALKSALASGNNIYLPKGVYITNEPLYVNVNTTGLKGESSQSIIKVGDKFPEGEAVVTFYSPNGDYNDRIERERTHGHFSVVGNEKNCDGVRIGGAVGTEYEGHTEGAIFDNILVDDCNVAFLWGAHAYKNTLIQCDSNDNKYSLKTAADITDTGEVFTCINCGFWSGVLHIADCGELMMYACTIHTKASQTVDGVSCGHYFKSAMVNFQNCHFESIIRTQEECDEVRSTRFLALNALVYLNECIGVVTGKYMTLGAPMFVDESTDGISHGIFINGGQWKYYLGRLKVDLLTKGYVEFSNLMLKYAYDGVIFPYKIYEHTTHLCMNRQGGFDYYHQIPEENIEGMTITESTHENSNANGGSEKHFTITNPKWYQNPAAGFYRKVDISKYKTCKLKGSYSIANKDYNFTYTDKVAGDSGVIEPSILMFADMYDNFISWGDPHNSGNLYRNGEDVGEFNKLEIEGRAIAIPPGAKYAYIGFDLRHGGGIPSGTITVISDMIYEFM